DEVQRMRPEVDPSPGRRGHGHASGGLQHERDGHGHDERHSTSRSRPRVPPTMTRRAGKGCLEICDSVRAKRGDAMPSRRDFLTTMAVGFGASALAPRWAAAADAATIKSPLNGPIGLQLWSLREYLPKDLPGSLAKVRGMGFT